MFALEGHEGDHTSPSLHSFNLIVLMLKCAWLGRATVEKGLSTAFLQRSGHVNVNIRVGELFEPVQLAGVSAQNAQSARPPPRTWRNGDSSTITLRWALPRLKAHYRISPDGQSVEWEVIHPPVAWLGRARISNRRVFVLVIWNRAGRVPMPSGGWSFLLSRYFQRV